MTYLKHNQSIAASTISEYAAGEGVTIDGVILKDGLVNNVDVAAISGGSVSNAAYGSGWDGDTTTAPSKNAVYDKIETLGNSGLTQAQIMARVSIGF